MKKYHITVYNINSLKTIDEFTSSFHNLNELTEFMDNIQLHNYNYDYFDLGWIYTEKELVKWEQWLYSYYQSQR